MKTLLLILSLGYVATCIIAGLLGIFAAPSEMRLLYHLDPGTMEGVRASDLMGQFTFMKAMELGLGLFALARLGPILEGDSERRLFTVVVAGGLLARALAWLQFGPPSLAFLIFMVLEAALLATLLAEGRISDAG